MNFDEWLAKIDECAVRDGWVEAGRSYTAEAGRECWQDGYDDGLTPEEQWQEEVSAAATML